MATASGRVAALHNGDGRTIWANEYGRGGVATVSGRRPGAEGRMWLCVGVLVMASPCDRVGVGSGNSLLPPGVGGCEDGACTCIVQFMVATTGSVAYP